jgi:hypothetical protein
VRREHGPVGGREHVADRRGAGIAARSAVGRQHREARSRRPRRRHRPPSARLRGRVARRRCWRGRDGGEVGGAAERPRRRRAAYTAGHDDLAAATRHHGLEGVVAKRLDARYVEGRRSNTWVKTKHRRTETLIVSAWQPGLGRCDELLVSRRDPQTGQLRNAGRVPVRLRPAEQTVLRESLAAIERPRRTRGRIRILEPVLAVG